MVSGWNWLINFPYLTSSQVLSDSSQAISRSCVYCKSTIQHFIYTGVAFFFLNLVLYMATVAKNIQLDIINSPDIGLAVRVFANGPGDLGSISGRVIPKTQKMVLDASLLNTQHYMVRIKGKVEPSREGVAPSPTSWCSSYRKESLRVTFDYGRQLYFTYIYLEIWKDRNKNMKTKDVLYLIKYAHTHTHIHIYIV